MILYDLSIEGKKGLFQLHTGREKILSISPMCGGVDSTQGGLTLSLQGGTLYPGLINSHDHLDFNSFPQLGGRVYANYREWGRDIHERNKDRIASVKRIPQALRIRWGIYKNLLNGFTTVVNHGSPLHVDDELISVFQDTLPLHSPAFEKNWRWKLNASFRRSAFVMHIGEGTDAVAGGEIAEVIRWNLWRKKIVAIHGMTMAPAQARGFAGLVWCPCSNYFLFGSTAPVDRLKAHTRLVFGTDSTLTAGWNAWEHFRQATGSGMVSEEELIGMLTETPAQLWGLPERGTVTGGKRADLLIMRQSTAGEKFSALNPEDILMVLHKGQIVLFDHELTGQLPAHALKGFSCIGIDGHMKWIKGDLPSLARELLLYDPDATIPFDYI